MSDKDSSVGTVIAAFAVGAVAGAVIALLLAPASGEETRRKLMDKAREGRRRLDELAHEGGEIVRERGEQVVSAIEKGREAFQRTREERL
jgi:gas vesicle protein